ncbi:MAG: hypothetical protein B5M53_11970 [Candidatus Cloacimonas sp. 4484_209]|nr:MAG: hypothetical protein B5M53_11970 [Candidatus Cloacimonas sp. 4484_209]
MLNTDFLNENLVAPATKFICTYNILFASANKAYLHPQINICTKIRKKWHDKKALDDIVFDALGLTEEERKEVVLSVKRTGIFLS